MTEQPQKEETLFIFKELQTNPNATQRDISTRLNISLGKTNYLLKELIKRGLVKAKHFSETSNKLRKINYMLTKEGLEKKIFLVKHFLEIKESEYNMLKKEWEELLTKKEC